MLKDVLDFIMARTQLSRETALREINYAWKELWETDDLPNSLFEVTVQPTDSNAIISLPYYVGTIRGVKQNIVGRERIALNTPRPYYQDETYALLPWRWRILGTSPINHSILNATTVTLTFDRPCVEQTIVTLMGPDDRGEEVREQIIFEIGDITKESTRRYSDFSQIAKNTYTTNNLRVLNAQNEELGFVPNMAYDAKYTIVQITDQCNKTQNWCRCFDILYKKICPILYFDEQPVAIENVLMAKTMEWITMPREGELQLASAFGDKARALLTAVNNNEQSIEHKMDIAHTNYETRYWGYL